MPPSPQPIHILGLGNVAKLLAHSLRRSQTSSANAQAHNPVINLIFHRESLFPEWKQAAESIEITREGICDRQTGFHVKTLQQPLGQLSNVIVTTKTHATVAALRGLKKAGTIDEVTTQVFPDPASRPHYLAAIINHGVYATAPFSSVHAGIASMFVGPVLSAGLPERDSSTESQTPLLTSLILQCPELRATSVSAEELLHIQLTKLAVNAVINPLSALLDCINGYIFESSTIRTLVDQLIDEISAVELAILASRDNIELDKETKTKFSADALRTHIYAVGVQVAKNISSMRQDMMAGRKTEIDYINGYLVSQGTTLGVPTPINEKIVQLVKDRRKITEDEAGEFFVPEMWSAVEFGVNSVAKHLD